MSKNAGKQKKKGIYNVLIVIFALIFVVSLGFLGYQLYDYYTAAKMVDEAKDLMNTDPSQDQLDGLPEGALLDYAAIYARYPDFRGWIKLNDSKLDYPVVQSKDNDFYLRRDMNGDYHRLGTVFADYRNTFDNGQLSDNTILYGHHAYDGSYFKDLTEYKKMSFYETHQFVQFDTLYERSEWVIVGAFLTNVLESQGPVFEYFNYIDVDEEDFNEYVDGVKERSYFTTDVPVEYGDKLLTLSTCDYEFEEGRFVVVARKLREGETSDKLQINYSQNTSKKMPDIWYKKNK